MWKCLHSDTTVSNTVMRHCGTGTILQKCYLFGGPLTAGVHPLLCLCLIKHIWCIFLLRVYILSLYVYVHVYCNFCMHTECACVFVCCETWHSACVSASALHIHTCIYVLCMCTCVRVYVHAHVVWCECGGFSLLFSTYNCVAVCLFG